MLDPLLLQKNIVDLLSSSTGEYASKSVMVEYLGNNQVAFTGKKDVDTAIVLIPDCLRELSIKARYNLIEERLMQQGALKKEGIPHDPGRRSEIDQVRVKQMADAFFTGGPWQALQSEALARATGEVFKEFERLDTILTVERGKLVKENDHVPNWATIMADKGKLYIAPRHKEQMSENELREMIALRESLDRIKRSNLKIGEKNAMRVKLVATNKAKEPAWWKLEDQNGKDLTKDFATVMGAHFNKEHGAVYLVAKQFALMVQVASLLLYGKPGLLEINKEYIQEKVKEKAKNKEVER